MLRHYSQQHRTGTSMKVFLPIPVREWHGLPAALISNLSIGINLSAKVFLDQFTTLQEERSPKDYQLAGGYARTEIKHRELNYQFIASVIGDLGKHFSIRTLQLGVILCSQNNPQIMPASQGLSHPNYIILQIILEELLISIIYLKNK